MGSPLPVPLGYSPDVIRHLAFINIFFPHHLHIPLTSLFFHHPSHQNPLLTSCSDYPSLSSSPYSPFWEVHSPTRDVAEEN